MSYRWSTVDGNDVRLNLRGSLGKPPYETYRVLYVGLECCRLFSPDLSFDVSSMSGQGVGEDLIKGEAMSVSPASEACQERPDHGRTDIAYLYFWEARDWINLGAAAKRQVSIPAHQ